MNFLPILGFLAGLVLRRRLAFVVTLVAEGIGLTVVALFTDEIEGLFDPDVWALTAIALGATALGIWLGRRFATPRLIRRAG
ncbi:MAG TPA: hypothetical protein VKC65_08710 [Gaiellaceae bacterium]|nr:hypothetical protein [Gaiellaceae bacterium]